MVDHNLLLDFDFSDLFISSKKVFKFEVELVKKFGDVFENVNDFFYEHSEVIKGVKTDFLF